MHICEVILLYLASKRSEQHSMCEDITIAIMSGRGHWNRMRGLPPPPPVPRRQSVEEYEDMEQHSASTAVTMATLSGRDHRSQTWGLPPPPPLPIKDNADPQYEDMTQYNASEAAANHLVMIMSHNCGEIRCYTLCNLKIMN